MSLPEIKADSTRYLLVGYFILAVMFSMLWWLDTHQIDSQKNLIYLSDVSAKKMRISADLIEILRTRILLSNEMLLEADAFVRDDLFVEIEQFGGLYINYLRKLEQLPLNERERQIIKQQQVVYEQLDNKLDDLSSMLFEVNQSVVQKVQGMIVDEIVPMQAEIIDGYMTILRDIQIEISQSSENSLLNFEENQAYRYMLLIAVTIGSISVLIWIMRLMIKIEKSLHTTSLMDKLTGVSNRRCFDQMFNHIWDDSMRSKKIFALLLIDIDHFKLYNDFYGHQQGDVCLNAVAQAIKSVIVRKNDVVSRYGGEEFAVILPDTDRKGAELVAEKLLEAIRMLNISHEKSLTDDKVTMSIGIAIVLPSSGMEQQSMLEEADQALYIAKETGRNRASLINDQFRG